MNYSTSRESKKAPEQAPSWRIILDFDIAKMTFTPSMVLTYSHPPDTQVRALRARTGIFGRYGARKFDRRP
jgi:hypothetical protein